MTRILIADDHAVVRTGLKQILAETRDIEVVGEAASGHEVLSKVRGQSFDLILLDISLPGLNGLDVLKQLKRESPELPVLMLTMYPEEQFAVRTLKAGASGYLTKDSAPTELVRAIRRIAQGGRYISAALAERLVDFVDVTLEQPLHELLSDREMQVMTLLASGKSVSSIAEEISLSVKTVSTYRARILEKMRLKNNSEIVRYALEHRLVS